jgi:putative SOS response-associated peptidase YedK
LVVVDSFSLGKGSGKTIQMENHRPFGIGGTWERWQRDGNEPLDSCAVITAQANDLVMPINGRMPVIIAEKEYGHWLDPEFFDLPELEQMMPPFPTEDMFLNRS